MKLIYQNGYSKDELLLFRLTIYKSEYNHPVPLPLGRGPSQPNRGSPSVTELTKIPPSYLQM